MSPSCRLALASCQPDCPLEFLFEFPRTLYGCLTNLLTLSLVLCPFAHSRCPSHIESLVSLVSAHCLSHSFAISLSLLFSHTHLLIHSLTHILSRCLGHSLGHCHFHRTALTPTCRRLQTQTCSSIIPLRPQHDELQAATMQKQ